MEKIRIHIEKFPMLRKGLKEYADSKEEAFPSLSHVDNVVELYRKMIGNKYYSEEEKRLTRIELDELNAEVKKRNSPFLLAEIFDDTNELGCKDCFEFGDTDKSKSRLDKTFASEKEIKKTIEKTLYSFSTVNNPRVNKGKHLSHELVAVISLELNTVRYSVRKNGTEVRSFEELSDGVFHYNLLY